MAENASARTGPTPLIDWINVEKDKALSGTTNHFHSLR